jgi:hypothetical protein
MTHAQKNEQVYIALKTTASVVYWSEFLATDSEARVRFPALPDSPPPKKK